MAPRPRRYWNKRRNRTARTRISPMHGVVLLVLQDRFKEAAAQFSRAIAAEPAAVSHRHELAVTLLKDGRPDAARATLREAEGLAPRDQMTLGTQLLAARLLDDADFLDRFDVDDWAREIELPVPAGFANAAEFNAALAAELTLLHSRRVAPLEQTLNCGTQTPAALFGRPSRLLPLLEESSQTCHCGLHKHPARRSPSPFPVAQDTDFRFRRLVVVPPFLQRISHQSCPFPGLAQLGLLCRSAFVGGGGHGHARGAEIRRVPFRIGRNGPAPPPDQAVDR